MLTIKDAAEDFLAHKRIAVTGVSRHPESHGANVVYRRLRDRGYKVFPGGVEAVVIGTSPEHADETMHECADLGIEQVWMHRSFGGGSVSDTATLYGREHGITVIDGGCPCMFGLTADSGHKVMKVFATLAGNIPKKV